MASVCPGCTHENKDGAKFCKRCGMPIALRVTCGRCGASNDGGARYCDECGAALGAVAAIDSSYSPDVQTKTRRCECGGVQRPTREYERRVEAVFSVFTADRQLPLWWKCGKCGHRYAHEEQVAQQQEIEQRREIERVRLELEQRRRTRGCLMTAAIVMVTLVAALYWLIARA